MTRQGHRAQRGRSRLPETPSGSSEAQAFALHPLAGLREHQMLALSPPSSEVSLPCGLWPVSGSRPPRSRLSLLLSSNRAPPRLLPSLPHSLPPSSGFCSTGHSPILTRERTAQQARSPVLGASRGRSCMVSALGVQGHPAPSTKWTVRDISWRGGHPTFFHPTSGQHPSQRAVGWKGWK